MSLTKCLFFWQGAHEEENMTGADDCISVLWNVVISHLGDLFEKILSLIISEESLWGPIEPSSIAPVTLTITHRSSKLVYVTETNPYTEF